MQEPGSHMGSSLPPSRPKRRRQRRTVYSAQQRRELEAFFENNRRPTYRERETLAAKLNLPEDKLQVWFKNRRAKYRRLLGPPRKQGPENGAEVQGPGVCAPAPVPGDPVLSEGLGFCSSPLPSPLGISQEGEPPVFPEVPVSSEGPVFAEDPLFSGDPWFSESLALHGDPVCSETPDVCSLPQSSSCGVFPGTEPSASSHSLAWWDPALGSQTSVPAAPAPAPAVAPVCPQGSCAMNFSPEPAATPGFTDLHWPQSPFNGCSSSRPGCQEDDLVYDWDTTVLLAL